MLIEYRIDEQIAYRQSVGCAFCRAPVAPGQDFCAECLMFDPAAEREYANDQHELRCQEYHNGLASGEDA